MLRVIGQTQLSTTFEDETSTWKDKLQILRYYVEQLTKTGPDQSIVSALELLTKLKFWTDIYHKEMQESWNKYRRETSIG